MKLGAFLGSILAGLAVTTFLVVPAQARHGDKGVFCASGKHVKNIKQCKEHGGTK